MPSKPDAPAEVPHESPQGPDLSHILAATRAPDHPQAMPGGQVQAVSNAYQGYRLTPEPEPAPSQADVLCPNAECNARLVVVYPDGARELQVYERHVRRPHLLTPDDLPLAWKCHQCGTAVTIA